jgi:two-component system OmpR family sensor kinase
MGRLYWKFFSFVLAAQLLATLAIGGAFWLREAARAVPTIDAGPPAVSMVKAADVVFQVGGLEAMRTLLRSIDGAHQLYMVDENGNELLGRDLNQRMLGDARELLALAQPYPVVRELRSSDGRRYLVFQSQHDVTRMIGSMPPFRSSVLLPRMHAPPSSRTSVMEFAGVLAAIVVSAVFAAMLAWYFAKPIKILRGALRDAGAGNLQTKAATAMGSRRDELADLGRDFDSMATRLAVLMDGQRNLLHDVSHELRSPLARMQAAIGLARQQPERTQPALERIEREGMRMDRLIGELLTLSRLEAGVATAQPEPVMIDELLAEIVEDATFEAQLKRTTVTLAGHCHVAVMAQPELLYRAIENVVRNAIKYTQAGSTVTLDCSLEPAGGKLLISILDNGPGAPPDVLQQMFTPFFRGGQTPSNPEGHGLGLAIAQRVVHTHGGSIRAENRSTGGLCVRIMLPMLPAQAMQSGAQAA